MILEYIRGRFYVFFSVGKDGWPRILIRMKRTTRGEKILNGMVANPNCELTESGKNWLIQVMDPFHDRPFVKTGWPDNNTRPSVIRQIKQAITISATSGGGAPVTNPWDCHIAWLPVLNSTDVMTSTSRTNNGFVTSTAIASPNVGGLMARASFTTGTPVGWMPALGGGTILGQIGINSTFLSGDTRLVGVGFEITDVSAEISKQGMLTAYAYPQLEKEETFIAMDSSKPAGNLRDYPFSGRRVILPPTTVGEALLLPESRQWEAKYGAYCVPTFQTTVNIPGDNTTVQPVYEEATTVSTVGLPNNAQLWVPRSTSAVSQVSGAVTNEHIVSPLQKLAPTNSSGVVLSGLNPNSAFNVSLIYYLETIPRLNDQALLVLTQPPPPHDPCALEIYTRCISRLPPAVMVGDNASGEWFWKVVEEVAKFAAPVVGMIPHPIAKAAVPALMAAQVAAHSMREEKKEKRKKKKNGPPPLPPRTAANYASRGALVNSVPMRKPLPPQPKKRAEQS